METKVLRDKASHQLIEHGSKHEVYTVAACLN